MSHFRFNHVFTVLLVLSAGSAFVISPRVSDRVRASAQGLFAPISRPVHLAGGWLHARIGNVEPMDMAAANAPPRAEPVVYQENEQLRLIVASLTAQLEELKRINADREALGDVRALCTPVAVIGGDSGTRDSLAVQRPAGIELRAGMPVLYAGGLAGRIERAGATGAQVRLITDRGFRITGSFGRFVATEAGAVEFVRIHTPAPLVEGTGKGTMSVRNLPMAAVESAGLAPNDWVVLDVNDWPMNLAGYKVGRVVSITDRSNAPGFAEIHLQPSRNLLRLREVMVLTGGAGG
jgi:hypothetical protein